MKQEENNTKSKKWQQLGYKQRLRIEVLHKEKHRASEIAERLGYSKRTIERELALGKVSTRRTKPDAYAVIVPTKREYIEIWEYSADAAEARHRERSSAKGKAIKLGNNYAFATYIEEKISKAGMSPYAALQQAKLENKPFAGLVCVKTLYNYIERDYFEKITNKDLWEKKKGKRRNYSQIRPAYNNLKGRSIDERPKEIAKRLEIGHWEMDTVVGKGKTCLLVLTERLTRRQIIRKLRSRSQDEVIRALDKLERRWGTKQFRKTFKTITSDNGGEFLAQAGIEASCINTKRKRTAMYYCHPYCAWERGSNENANKLIRRFIPKGSNIADYSEAEIQRIEHYMNNYPRKLLGGYPPNSLYQQLA